MWSFSDQVATSKINNELKEWARRKQEPLLMLFSFQVCEAVNTISDVAKGNQPEGGQSSFEGPGELAAALDDFDASLIINPLTYNEAKNRKTLEESLESIISGAALLADSRY